MGFHRRPRFTRVPPPKPMRLTGRDWEILRRLHRHRFLRSHQVAQLVGGSRQQVLRRLQLLFHHGFLERPRAQLEPFGRPGSRPLVYGLGNKGAAVLKKRDAVPFHRLDWGPRNRAVGRIFLEHALMVSDVLVAVELACRDTPGLRFIPAHEIPLPERTARLRQPFRWQVDLTPSRRVGVVPDGVFGIERPGAGRPPAYFFLEADRGTMPIQRRNPRQSSFLDKLHAYAATWATGLHQTRFAFRRFRVLVVTSSPERLKHLLDASRTLRKGQGLFLFKERESVTRGGEIL